MLSRSTGGALLLGRIPAAALFPPSEFNILVGFSSFAALLDMKGIPYPEIVAGMMVSAEVLGPLALIIGLWPCATALAPIGLNAIVLWLTHGSSMLTMVLRPGQHGEFFERLAIIGGLQFYRGGGPGEWSRTSLR